MRFCSGLVLVLIVCFVFFVVLFVCFGGCCLFFKESNKWN